MGFRTRKGRLPRRQYLARARLEFRAGLRVVVSSRARAFGISCGLLAGGAVGWLAALAADGSRYAAPAGLRGMVSLRGPARLVSPAPARLAALAAEREAAFVTLFYGEGVSQEEAEAAQALFTEACPETEVSRLSGGQPVYYYTISIE